MWIGPLQGPAEGTGSWSGQPWCGASSWIDGVSLLSSNKEYLPGGNRTLVNEVRQQGAKADAPIQVVIVQAAYQEKLQPWEQVRCVHIHIKSWEETQELCWSLISKPRLKAQVRLLTRWMVLSPTCWVPLPALHWGFKRQLMLVFRIPQGRDGKIWLQCVCFSALAVPAWTVPSSPLRPQLRREMRSRSWILSCEGYSPEQGPSREGPGLHQTSDQSPSHHGSEWARWLSWPERKQ